MKFLTLLLLSLLVVAGCTEPPEKDGWEESSTFKLRYKGKDNHIHNYVLLGDEKRLGFLVGPYQNKDGEVLDQAPIIADKPSKYMWYFWGEKEELKGKLKVVGINKDGKKSKILLQDEEKVWEYPIVGYRPQLGADSHMPSSMVFPTAGLWKLEVYIGGDLFGNVFVSVVES